MFRRNISKFEITGKGKGVASNNKFFSRGDLEEAIGEKIVVCSINIIWGNKMLIDLDG